MESPEVVEDVSLIKKSRGALAVKLPDGAVEPFPRERFLKFVRVLKVQTKDYGLVHLNLLGSQLYVLDEIISGLEEGITTFVILKARQLGISTFFLALDLFWAFEHAGLLGVFATHDEGSRDQFRNQIEIFLTTLPASHRIDYETNNRLMLVLKNSSLFRYLVAGTRTTTNKLGRSGGSNFLHATECAFWGSPEDVKALGQTLSELYRFRLYIYESTANGFNHYYDMWEVAKSSPAQRAIFIGWWRDERNEFDEKHPLYLKYMPHGTKTPLTPLERARIKTVKKEYGFEITAGQIAWYRFHLETKTGNDQATMDQEMPWCVVAGTRVGTDKGILKIENITPGMKGTLGEILQAMPMGAADIWKARTRLGYEVEGTGDHPLINEKGKHVFIKDSMKSVVLLQPPVFASKIFVFTWSDGITESAIKITPEFSRLAGIFMGDGCLSGSGPRSGHEFSIACYGPDRDFIDATKKLVFDLFGVELKENSKGKLTRLRANSRLIYETFKKLSLVKTDTGKTMRRVHVPEFIFQSPKSVVKEFLSGLFETDGFNGYKSPRVCLFSKHELFLKDVQILLLGFGITCKRNKSHRKNKTHSYIASELELRKNEAIKFNKEIGFLSSRKQNRFKHASRKKKYDKSSLPLVLKDTVLIVEDTGKSEEVYNLTIEGRHLFDANGILTHNTAEDAFVATGASFFATPTLTLAMKEAKKSLCMPFVFRLTEHFEDIELHRSNIERAELKIWEKPSKSGEYVIGADPSFGSSPDSDNGVIHVARCYADCMVQVAEYACASTSTHQFAWVLAFLAGLYKNVTINLELTGPGTPVYQELRQLRQRTAEMAPSQDNDMRNCLKHIKDFLFSRPDSLSGSLVRQWRTSPETRTALLHKFKSGVELTRCRLKSLLCLEEMRKIVIDEGYIGVPAGKHDDRVFAAGLAYWAWDERIRPKLHAEGKTLAHENQADLQGAPDPIEGLVNKFLKNANIRVKQ